MESIEARTSLLENEKPSFFHRFLGSWDSWNRRFFVLLFHDSIVLSFSRPDPPFHRVTFLISYFFFSFIFFI